jgi:hypothetical protein
MRCGSGTGILMSPANVFRERPVEEGELRQAVKDQLGLRVGPHMTRYLLEKSADAAAQLPMIGADARTGIPRREMFDSRRFRSELS